MAMLRPDLVIMDVRMPKMDGFAAASIAPMRYPPITVILMSGDEAPELRSWATRRGVLAITFKPNLALEFAAFWPATVPSSFTHMSKMPGSP